MIYLLTLISLVLSQPSGSGGPGEDNSGDDSAPGDDSGDTTEAVYCDPCGADAAYLETIDTSGTYAKRLIESNGCPNHYNYCTGKDNGECGAEGEEGTVTEALVQEYAFEVPANPILASSNDYTPECVTDTIAMALNGVPIYSGAVSADCDILDMDDESAEWTSFDFCGGHGRCLMDDCTGDYHYHFPASCLETQIGKLSDGHSPQIGWSLDGFPIYGPYGPNGMYMTHTAQGCTGDYCLDDCSGLEMEMEGLDDFKYRYYFNGPLSDLESLPTYPRPASSDYPFALKCYRGCTIEQMEAGDSRCSGAASGVTDDYSASAMAGVTAVFESAAASAAGLQCQDTGTTQSPDETATSEPTVEGQTNEPTETPAPTAASSGDENNDNSSAALTVFATLLLAFARF